MLSFKWNIPSYQHCCPTCKHGVICYFRTCELLNYHRAQWSSQHINNVWSWSNARWGAGRLIPISITRRGHNSGSKHLCLAAENMHDGARAVRGFSMFKLWLFLTSSGPFSSAGWFKARVHVMLWSRTVILGGMRMSKAWWNSPLGSIALLRVKDL